MKRMTVSALLLVSTGVAYAQPSATGTWTVSGDLQGTPVNMTCVLTEAGHKLTGSCTGAGDGTTVSRLTGQVTDRGLGWRFQSEYAGAPIMVSVLGAVTTDGAKINGSMAVAPMEVQGTFVAVKQ